MKVYDPEVDAAVNLARAGFAIAAALDRVAHQIDRLGLNETNGARGGPGGAVDVLAQSIEASSEALAKSFENAMKDVSDAIRPEPSVTDD